MIAELKPHEAYEPTRLPWVELAPAHWKLVPNRAYLRRRKVLVGKYHKDFLLLSLTKQGVIVRDLSKQKGKFSSDMGTSQEVRRGDLVFCLFDVPETPRTVGLSKHDGMITGAYCVFECRDARAATFLERFYIAMDDRKLLSPLYSGLRHTIPAPVFLGAKTPLPPPDEQELIVRFLDWASVRLGKAIAAKRNVIKLLEEQKQVIIHRAVTRGLDDSVSLTTSGQIWIEKFPVHWQLKPNRSLMQVRKELVGAKSGNYKVLSLTKRGVIVRDMDAGGKYLSFLERSQIVRSGDLVFCLFDVDETPRAVGLSKFDGMISPDYTVMECCSPLIASFLECFYIAIDDRKMLKPLYTGLRKRISKPLFRAAKTPIPPEAEIKQILAYVKDGTSELDRSIDALSRQIKFVQEYRTRLLADVVTGVLDVRDFARTLPDNIAEEAAELADSDLGEEDFSEADEELIEEPA